ncbi:MAG: hypothetical protein AAFX79_10570 [Planctomycetota bacterium]
MSPETPAAPPTNAPAPAEAPRPRPGPPSLERASLLRDAFWHDICREILTTLSIEGLRRAEAANNTLPSGQQIVTSVGTAAPPAPELFDGRMAILTHGGERIPIGQVYPMLACGINSDPTARAISQAVECSIFQIRTPPGELYTLPVSEIRAFHALTPELMAQIEAAGRAQQQARRRPSGSTESKDDLPFGFEAYTSLARNERERQESEDPYYPASP